MDACRNIIEIGLEIGHSSGAIRILLATLKGALSLSTNIECFKIQLKAAELWCDLAGQSYHIVVLQTLSLEVLHGFHSDSS